MNNTEYTERYGDMVGYFKYDEDWKKRTMSELDTEFLALHRQCASIPQSEAERDQLRDIIYRAVVYRDCQNTIASKVEQLKFRITEDETDQLRHRPVRFTRLDYKGC